MSFSHQNLARYSANTVGLAVRQLRAKSLHGAKQEASFWFCDTERPIRLYLEGVCIGIKYPILGRRGRVDSYRAWDMLQNNF